MAHYRIKSYWTRTAEEDRLAARLAYWAKRRDSYDILSSILACPFAASKAYRGAYLARVMIGRINRRIDRMRWVS